MYKTKIVTPICLTNLNSEPINRGCTVANPPVFFSHSPKSTKMAGALKKVNKFFKVKSFALGLTVDLLLIYNIYIV